MFGVLGVLGCWGVGGFGVLGCWGFGVDKISGPIQHESGELPSLVAA